IAEGDLVVASYSSQHAVFDALMSERPLADAAELARSAMTKLERWRDTTTAPRVAAMAQLIHNLRFGGQTPWRLTGSFVDAHLTQAEGLENTERGMGLYAAMLAAAFGADEHLVALHDRWAGHFDKTPFHSQSQHWVFLTGISLMKLGRRPA